MARAPTHLANDQFLVTFCRPEDPAPDLVAYVVKRLQEAAAQTAETIVPGTLRIAGEETAIRSAMQGLRDWRVSREGSLGITPPARGRLRAG